VNRLNQREPDHQERYKGTYDHERQ
jgi:hypothetical protein